MATGSGPVWSLAKSRRMTTVATAASSLPAFVRTCVARSSWQAATAGKRPAKSGAGVEFAARARSLREVTPQVLIRAADRDEFGGEVLAKVGLRGSAARRTALTAARPIQWAEPSSPIANPQPPARTVVPC